MIHKAGFVNIIGRANVGKSTLLNALMQLDAAIINKKPQTTRHRLKAMMNGEDFQIILSDTPGYIEDPRYELQEAMNGFVHTALEDADIMLFVVDPSDTDPAEHPLIKLLTEMQHPYPVWLLINKVDCIENTELDQLKDVWKNIFHFDEIFAISAAKELGIQALLTALVSALPEHPPFFDKEQWTDRSERFFVSEKIREHILTLYHQEIPYSAEVMIDSFKRGHSKSGPILRIAAVIYVSRPSQKYILIGNKGEAIKELGVRSRKTLEAFFDERIHLEIHVKSRKDWRDNKQWLKNFGYEA